MLNRRVAHSSSSSSVRVFLQTWMHDPDRTTSRLFRGRQQYVLPLGVGVLHSILARWSSSLRNKRTDSSEPPPKDLIRVSLRKTRNWWRVTVGIARRTLRLDELWRWACVDHSISTCRLDMLVKIMYLDTVDMSISTGKRTVHWTGAEGWQLRHPQTPS